MKWPRHYAQGYILAGADKEAQKEALAGCPVEWRDLVKRIIKITKELNHAS